MLEGELGIDFLGASEMAHDDERTAAFKNSFECRDSPADTGIVGNIEVFVEGNVEIYADNSFFAGEIVRINVLLHVI